ncbi:MAG: hypothetical protein AAF909_04460 [Pseudomonadota bacterium]
MAVNIGQTSPAPRRVGSASGLVKGARAAPAMGICHSDKGFSGDGAEKFLFSSIDARETPMTKVPMGTCEDMNNRRESYGLFGIIDEF